MLKQSSFRRVMLLAVAVVGLTCSPSVSRASILDILPRGAPRGEARSPETIRQSMGVLSEPRAVRQAKLVTCNINNPALGSNICLMTFDAVPAGRVLQIEKLNCLGGTTSGVAILFNTQVAVDDAHLVAFVMPPYEGIGGGVASGPYYFKAGEKPKLVTTGSAPTDQAFCSMMGTLWQTN